MKFHNKPMTEPAATPIVPYSASEAPSGRNANATENAPLLMSKPPTLITKKPRYSFSRFWFLSAQMSEFVPEKLCAFAPINESTLKIVHVVNGIENIEKDTLTAPNPKAR